MPDGASENKVRSTRNSGDAYQSRDDLPELPVRFCGQGEGENLCQSKNYSYHLCRGWHRGLNCRPKMRLYGIIVYKQ